MFHEPQATQHQGYEHQSAQYLAEHQHLERIETYVNMQSHPIGSTCTGQVNTLNFASDNVLSSRAAFELQTSLDEHTNELILARGGLIWPPDMSHE